MQNWKIALLSALLFTFVALPAIGQEMNVPSLKKLDLISWGSEILLAEEHSTESSSKIEVHALSGDEEKEETHSELEKHSMAGDYSTESSGKKEENWLLHFLRNVFSSAMSF